MSDRRLQASRDDRRRDRDGDARGADARGDRRDRRRSRSPAGGIVAGPQGSSGGGRRYERRDDVDSYSSSRGYREREREDRYGGRERNGGGDRDWGRDRGVDRGSERGGDRGSDRGADRRDQRRGDDDRRREPRRDRDDLFSDRRRGGRDDRGDRSDRRDDRERDTRRDRDDERELERQTRKSPEPQRKPKEPTPDLTDVVPILERKRRLTQWDIKPAGYENITAEQAKMSGMYPLPGAPQAQRQPMDPQRLQAFMSQPGNQASQTALKPNTARQSKRLMVYNISETLTDSGIVDFFNLQLNGLNVTRNNDPCVSAHLSKDRSFALLEFKTPEDATTAMTLMNGVNLDASTATSNGHSNGTSAGLRIERPKDYIVPSVAPDVDGDNGALSNVVPDTHNKLTVANLPVNLDEAQILELLQSFGPLKSFILVSYAGEDVSRGIAFLEYKDSAHTEVAIEALNGMDLGSMPLKISRACIGTQQVGGEMSVNAISMMAGTKASEFSNGRVLCLMNMITPAELMDPEEADEILEDITEECAKFGALLDTKMPRPVGGARQGSGVGKIFLKYESPDSAAKALSALAGRNFSGRTVVVTYFSEENFDLNIWT